MAPRKCAHSNAPAAHHRYSDKRCLPKGCVAGSQPLASGHSGEWWGLGNPNTTECPHQQWSDGSWPGIPEYTEANNKYSSCVDNAKIDCAMALHATHPHIQNGAFAFGTVEDGATHYLTVWNWPNDGAFVDYTDSTGKCRTGVARAYCSHFRSLLVCCTVAISACCLLTARPALCPRAAAPTGTPGRPERYKEATFQNLTVRQNGAAGTMTVIVPPTATSQTNRTIPGSTMYDVITYYRDHLGAQGQDFGFGQYEWNELVINCDFFSWQKPSYSVAIETFRTDCSVFLEQTQAWEKRGIADAHVSPVTTYKLKGPNTRCVRTISWVCVPPSPHPPSFPIQPPP